MNEVEIPLHEYRSSVGRRVLSVEPSFKNGRAWHSLNEVEILLHEYRSSVGRRVLSVEAIWLSECTKLGKGFLEGGQKEE